MKIKGQQDFWSGILFISFGILALVIARDYPIGEARRMGPGFFPIYIGIGLLILGAIIVAMGLKIDGEKIGSFKRAWRPIFFNVFGIYGFCHDHRSHWFCSGACVCEFAQCGSGAGI